jgi:molybdopterin/thiamine biosynthesis adenylyltransferase
MTDFSRLDFFVRREDIRELNLVVIGVGAIGRNVASMLGRLGPATLTIVDDDTIEDHNISAQNWRKSSIGMKKVDVVAEEIEDQIDDVSIIRHAKRWSPKDFIKGSYDFIWSTVDSIETRGRIFEFFKDRSRGLFDVRIGGPVIQNLFVDFEDTTDQNGDWYRNTIFPPSESHRFGCVQPMSNYIAGMAAGISVNTFTNKINRKHWSTPKFTTFNAIDMSFSQENPLDVFQES